MNSVPQSYMKHKAWHITSFRWLALHPVSVEPPPQAPEGIQTKTNIDRKRYNNQIDTFTRQDARVKFLTKVLLLT